MVFVNVIAMNVRPTVPCTIYPLKFYGFFVLLCLLFGGVLVAGEFT